MTQHAPIPTPSTPSSAQCRQVRAPAGTPTASRLALVIIAIPLLATTGCATPTGSGHGTPSAEAAKPAPSQSVDPGPMSSTAVVTTTLSIDGRMMPVMRGQQTVATRADMRRTDSEMQFDNWLIRQVAGDGRSADIIRLDRSLVWTLHPAKRSYRECALSGCGSAIKPETEKPARDKEKPREPAEPKCPLQVKSNTFSVTASGEKRRINAFDTERFLLTWKLELQDPQKQVARNEVVLELWTTPETAQIREVRRINEAFDQRWHATARPGEHPFGRYVPPEVIGSMASLIRGAGSKGFAKWAGDMKKVHGYPIVTKMSWNVAGKVCGEQGDDARSAAGTTPTSVGGLLGGLLAGQVKNEVAESAASGALLTFTHEVQTMAVKPVADSSFSPPPDFQKEAPR